MDRRHRWSVVVQSGGGRQGGTGVRRQRRHARLCLRVGRRPPNLAQRKAARRQPARLSPGRRSGRGGARHGHPGRVAGPDGFGPAGDGQRGVRRLCQLAALEGRKRPPARSQFRVADEARNLSAAAGVFAPPAAGRARAADVLRPRSGHRQAAVRDADRVFGEHERHRSTGRCRSGRPSDRQVSGPAAQPLRTLFALPERRLSGHRNGRDHADHGPVADVRLARQSAAGARRAVPAERGGPGADQHAPGQRQCAGSGYVARLRRTVLPEYPRAETGRSRRDLGPDAAGHAASGGQGVAGTRHGRLRRRVGERRPRSRRGRQFLLHPDARDERGGGVDRLPHAGRRTCAGIGSAARRQADRGRMVGRAAAALGLGHAGHAAAGPRAAGFAGNRAGNQAAAADRGSGSGGRQDHRRGIGSIGLGGGERCCARVSRPRTLADR